MKRLNERIYDKLKQAVGKIAIYPGIGKNEAKYPYIVYNDDSYNTEYTKDGPTNEYYSYEISIYSDSFDEADELSDKIRQGLKGVRNEFIRSCRRTGGSAIYGDCFVRTLTYQIEVDGR